MTDDAVERLRELYEQLPQVECQGLCSETCGPITASDTELQLLKDAGFEIPPFTHEAHLRWKRGEPLRCPALTQLNRCAVHEIRPLICRLWGVGRDTLACPHGCRVNGVRVKTRQALLLLQRAYVIGGNVDEAELWTEIIRRSEDPRVGSLLLRLVKGDDNALTELLREL